MDPLKRPTAFDLVEKLSELTQTKIIHAQSSNPTRIEKLYEMALDIKDTNPKFAFALLRQAAAAGHRSAMLQVAEKLWLGEQVPANREFSKELAHRYCELTAKSNGSDVSEEIYQTAIAYLPNKEAFMDLMSAHLPSPEANLIMDYVAFQKPSYSFALMMLGEAADSGHTLAQEKVAEMLWSGLGASQDKALAIEYFSKAVATKPAYVERLVKMQIEYAEMLWLGTEIPQDKALAIQYFNKAVVTHPEYLERLDLMRAEYQYECQHEQETHLIGTPKQATEIQQLTTAAGNLRLAFQHFFGLDVTRNIKLAREFLVKATEFHDNRKPLVDLMSTYLPSPDVRKLISEYAVDSELLLAPRAAYALQRLKAWRLTIFHPPLMYFTLAFL